MVHTQRRQLMITSIATLALALLLLISSLVSYVQLIVFIAMFFLAISLITDGLAQFLFFRPQEGVIQLARGVILGGLFLLLFIQFLLK